MIFLKGRFKLFNKNNRLYSSNFSTFQYTPLNFLQKTLLIGSSHLLALVNPYESNYIAISGELTGYYALRNIRDIMYGDVEGATILKEKPRINELMTPQLFSEESLKKLPLNSLGNLYYRYMSSHGFKPSERTQVRFIEDPELAYIMQRYREVHDLIHTLSGLPPTILGELAVKLLEFHQSCLPMTLLSSAAIIRLNSTERCQYVNQVVPWAKKTSNQLRKNLYCVYYENYLDKDLKDIQSNLNFTPLHINHL